MAKKPISPDKKYLKRIAQAEEKPSEFAEPDIGADVGADIVEPGVAKGDYQARLKMLKHLPRRGKHHRRKRR
jgi:hypothetical protein